MTTTRSFARSAGTSESEGEEKSHQNHLIQPTLIGRSIDLPPWVALVSALVGASVGGLLGAVLAVPFVGAVRVMVVEWRRDDFPEAVEDVRPRRLPLGRKPAVSA